jgi:cell division protein FtsQ
MIKHKAYINATFFVLILIGLFSFAHNRNLKRKIKNVAIIFENGDNLFVTRKTVNKLLTQNLKSPKKVSKDKLNLKVLEKGILKNQMIENVDVYVDVGGSLKVLVKQRNPVLRINSLSGNYYLDDKGKKMPLSVNYSARVPLVDGVNDNDELKLLHRFYKNVLTDEFMKKQIVAISLNQDEFILKTRIGNHLIEFGKLQNVKNKISKLKVFYQKVIADNTYEKYKKINIKYNKQVVCTKKG